MEWSKYQKEIFRFVEEEQGSAVIIATAGSGKSSTIIECARRIPTDQRVAFVAFNRAIADELKAKVPPHVHAQTLNGMGFSALRRHLNARYFKLESRKTSAIMDENMTKEALTLYASGLRKLIGLAKAHGIVPKGSAGTGLTMDTEQNWADLIDKYNIEFEGNAKPEKAIEFARSILEQSIEVAQEQSFIDFDDQLYLPVIWQAQFEPYDFMFVDELQDLSMIQRSMIKMSLKQGGRMIGVADPAQSIYSFRGASIDAVNLTEQEFNAVELPLSISYRCPKSVVVEARKLVSHIEAADNAPDGKVETLGQFGADFFTNDDGIVCRNSAPIIDLAYKFLRSGKACRVLGREIGQGLIMLIKKMDADSIDDLEDKLNRYMAREVRKLIAKGKEEKADALTDRVATIRIFIDQVPETSRTVAKLASMIESLFTDNNKGLLTLCTVHKAKGLEFPRVFILDRYLMPSKWARQAWQQQEEKNIQYVAITRAMKELYYIDRKNWIENKSRGELK